MEYHDLRRYNAVSADATALGPKLGLDMRSPCVPKPWTWACTHGDRCVIHAAGIITLKIRIPAAWILYYTTCNTGCLDAIHYENKSTYI